MRTISFLVVSLLVACGDVSGPGGGDSDGGPDGGPGVDASVPGTVTVIVLDADDTRLPVEDVPVVFFEPDGAEADTVMTDGDGVASAEVHPGGAVIAFLTSTLPLGASTPMTYAVIDVRPGDEITLGGRRNNGELTESMTVELPALEGASGFSVVTPCGSHGEGDNVVAVYDWDRCELTSDFAIVAYGFVGADTYVISDTGLEFSMGTNHVVAGAWELLPAPDVTIEGVDDVGVMFARWSRGILDGSNLLVMPPSDEGDADSDVLTLTPGRPGMPEHMMLEVGMGPEQIGLGSRGFYLWRDGDDDGELLLDADELLLPAVGAPAMDRATRRVFWNHVGEGDWDATYLTFSWGASDGKTSTFGEWRVVAPPGHHELVLPQVPDEYKEWLPDDIDQIGDAFVQLFDSDALDWDGARQLGLDPRDPLTYTGTFTEPANLRYSSSFFD